MKEVGKRQDEWCKVKYLYFGRIVGEIEGCWVPCGETGCLREEKK